MFDALQRIADRAALPDMDDSSGSSGSSEHSPGYVVRSRSSRPPPPRRPPPRAESDDSFSYDPRRRPTEPSSDEEINAEVTEGGWRCHLKRMVKLVGRRGHTVQYGRSLHKTKPILSEAFSRFGKPYSVVDEPGTTGPPAEPEVVSELEPRREVDSIYHLYRVLKHDQKRNLDSHDELGPVFYLEIRSPLVVRLLQNIVVYYPDQVLDGSTITVPEPYMLLWHHHRALRHFLDDASSDKDTNKHLQVLIEFLDSNEADATEFKNFDAAQKGSGTISFRNAWYLYRPGSRLLNLHSSRSLFVSSLGIVESVKAPRKYPDLSTPRYGKMMLTERDIAYDGMPFRWNTVSLTVHPQDWPANISDLQLLPMEHLVDQEEISRSLLERGLKFWQLQGQHLKEYVGDRPKDAPDVSS